jgi:hypothetical protein
MAVGPLIVSLAGQNVVEEFRTRIVALMESKPDRADVTFIPEPTNPYDPKAVKVFINNEHVGYVAKRDQPRLDKEYPVIFQEETRGFISSWGSFGENNNLYVLIHVEKDYAC